MQLYGLDSVLLQQSLGLYWWGLKGRSVSRSDNKMFNLGSFMGSSHLEPKARQITPSFSLLAWVPLGR